MALVLAFCLALPLVFIAVVLQGVTGGLLGPAIAAISLGLVGHSTLAERLGRSQRFGVTGALVGAALMGVAVFLLSCAHQRSVASPRRSSPRRHQCNGTARSHSANHCRSDLAQGIVWTAFGIGA